MAEETIRAITWEAPEHHHIEKGNDWFWAFIIIAIAATATAVVLGNILFATLIFLGAATMLVVALKEPQVLSYAVSTRGVRVGDNLYPYNSLESFCLDEENPDGPQLIVKSQHMFMAILVIPIPEEHVDQIDDILSEKLPEEQLDEPFAHKLLELFGF